MHDKYHTEHPNIASLDWPRHRLRDLGVIFSGGTPSRENPSFWGGDIPWVTPGELTDKQQRFLRFTREYITQSGLQGSGAVILPAKTLLVTTRATLGARSVASVPMATNQGFKNLVFHEELADVGFFYHLFEILIPELERRASGTTFLEISGKQFGEIKVPCPPLDQQRRIAEILDTIDAKISLTRQIISKLVKVESGLNRELLPWRPEYPLPIGWSFNKLENITSAPICYGIVQAGPDVPDGVPVVMIRDLEGGLQGQLHRTNASIDANYSRSRVKPRDVLISIKGTIGRIGIVPDGFSGNISRDVARLRMSPAIKPEFTAWLLTTSVGRELLDRAVVGTTRAEISIWMLKRIEIPIPPLAEQDRIIQIISSAKERLHRECDSLNKALSLKRGIMEDLLTGRVQISQAEASIEKM